MGKEPIAVNISGKFGVTGKAILLHLYKRPDGTIGTKDLMKILKPDQCEGEQEQKAYEEIQRGVETLLVAGLITGKRAPESERVYHIKLRLTPKGEKEAIKQRDIPDVIILDVPRPQWAKTP